jgi:hypothetical protein
MRGWPNCNSPANSRSNSTLSADIAGRYSSNDIALPTPHAVNANGMAGRQGGVGEIVAGRSAVATRHH